jgi:hypothetical protein
MRPAWVLNETERQVRDGATTFSAITLDIMTLSIMTIIGIRISIMILRIMRLSK